MDICIQCVIGYTGVILSKRNLGTSEKFFKALELFFIISEDSLSKEKPAYYALS